MKFLILKDTDDSRAYINTKQISLIQAITEEEINEDCTAIFIIGIPIPIQVKGNIKTVVNTVRLIDHGITSIDRDYDFEVI